MRPPGAGEEGGGGATRVSGVDPGLSRGGDPLERTSILIIWTTKMKPIYVTGTFGGGGGGKTKPCLGSRGGLQAPLYPLLTFEGVQSGSSWGSSIDIWKCQGREDYQSQLHVRHTLYDRDFV